MKFSKPVKPAQLTEHQLITAILNGTWPAGSVLPAERKLAEMFGVTRPTVREALQRLANEGWVTICHGKATEINDYWETGGLRLLGTLARHSEHLPESFVIYFLELREILMPPIARQAVNNAPTAISDILKRRQKIRNTSMALTDFDWDLQQQMARHSGNPIYPMMLNDFTTVYRSMGNRYFKQKIARSASLAYYEKLERIIDFQRFDSVEAIVERRP